MDKNTKLSQYLLQMIQASEVYFTGICGGVNSDGTVNVKRQGGNSVSAIAANITGSGDCSVFLVEGQYYAFSTSARAVISERSVINRHSKPTIFSQFKPAFLLINNESPQKTKDIQTTDSHYLSFLMGNYFTNIRLIFIQYGSGGNPIAGDINTSFEINYSGGSYTGNFNRLYYGDRQFFCTPIIYCPDIDVSSKTIDVSWYSSFTDPLSNIGQNPESHVATTLLIRVSNPVVVTNGIKQAQVSAFETEYYWSSNFPVPISQAGGGGDGIRFLLTNQKKFYIDLYQRPIRADVFSYSLLVNFPAINESRNQFILDTGLNSVSIPSALSGGSFFSFTPDNELFLKKKTLLVSGPGRIDYNYNPLFSPPKTNKVTVPANENIYNLSQACSNFGIVIF